MKTVSFKRATNHAKEILCCLYKLSITMCLQSYKVAHIYEHRFIHRIMDVFYKASVILSSNKWATKRKLIIYRYLIS